MAVLDIKNKILDKVNLNGLTTDRTLKKRGNECEERSTEIIQTEVKREEKKLEQSIHDINRIKFKNHMIISTDAEKNHITKLNTYYNKTLKCGQNKTHSI